MSNNDPKSKFLTRKDVARLTETSTTSVHNNERKWGLSTPDVRVNFNSRLVKYKTQEALARLRAIGAVEQPEIDAIMAPQPAKTIKERLQGLRQSPA